MMRHLPGALACVLSGVAAGVLLAGCNEKPTAAVENAQDSSMATDQQESTVKEHKSGEWSPELSDAEKETIFAIANDTLAWCAAGAKGGFSFEKYTLTEKLEVPTHTFVTLKKRGALRGCIGSLPPMPASPLYRSVHENAIHSAMHDTRFHPPFGPGPVSEKELPDIDIHVSLLSPVKDIASLDEFKIGEHGIILKKGRARAVYLPEVAPEQGWDTEATLASLSRKAGLGPDDWRKDATFQVYSSVVLSQE